MCSPGIARQPALPLVLDRDRECDRRSLPLRAHSAPHRVASGVHVARLHLPVLLREALHHSHQILAAGNADETLADVCYGVVSPLC